jgi:hypothetical protein
MLQSGMSRPANAAGDRSAAIVLVHDNQET